MERLIAHGKRCSLKWYVSWRVFHIEVRGRVYGLRVRCYMNDGDCLPTLKVHGTWNGRGYGHWSFRNRGWS